MEIITVDGVRLWYEIQGKGEPLVVIGGFYIGHHQFDFVTPLLSTQFQVINWNYQGIGQAERSVPPGNPVGLWVEQLREVLDTLGISKASLWATANGACIAFAFAAKYPDRVKKLISHPWYRSDERVKKFLSLSADLVDTYGFVGHVRAISTTLGLTDDFLYSDKGREFERWRVWAGEQTTSVENYRKMCEGLVQVDLTDSIGKIQAPTLLLMGEVGPLGHNPSMDSQVEFLSRTIPGCQLQTIPDSGGTLFMVLKPEESAKAALDFLASG